MASVHASVFFPQSSSAGTIFISSPLTSTKEGLFAFPRMTRASIPAVISSFPKPPPMFQLNIVPVRGDFDVRTAPAAIGAMPVSGPGVKIKGFPGLRGSISGFASSESNFTPSPLPPRYMWINCSSVPVTVTFSELRSTYTVFPVQPAISIPFLCLFSLSL